MPSPRSLVELRAPDIPLSLSKGSVLVQPVGSIEQHGPHLPYATDLIVAQSAAEAVVALRGEELDLWLLPPLVYTKSNEHAWAPGTIWLSATTLLAVLDDLGRALAKLPARRLAFVNGHGGNTALLNVACREIRINHRLMTFLLHPSVPPDHGGPSTEGELGMGVHAGFEETSVMLHLRPELVDMTAARRNIPTGLAENRHVRFGGDVAFGWTSDDFGGSGVIGDPTKANPEQGKLLFEQAVTALGEALFEVAHFEFS